VVPSKKHFSRARLPRCACAQAPSASLRASSAVGKEDHRILYSLVCQFVDEPRVPALVWQYLRRVVSNGGELLKSVDGHPFQ
jgi:hypothetical protein